MTEKVVEETLSLSQLLTLTLSILLLIGLDVENLITFTPAAARFFDDDIDFVVCLVFLFDFFNRLIRAPSKLEFMKWGWIDLISSIPTVGILQWGRVVRVLRILRILRIYRSTTTIWNSMSRNKPKATLRGAFLIAVITFIVSSVGILEFETSPRSTIKSPSDAVYWAFTTMITTGCDLAPLTSAGRCISSVLSMVGVGLMGIFTAYVASIFLNSSGAQNEVKELSVQVKKLREELRDFSPGGDAGDPALITAEFLKELNERQREFGTKELHRPSNPGSRDCNLSR